MIDRLRSRDRFRRPHLPDSARVWEPCVSVGACQCRWQKCTVTAGRIIRLALTFAMLAPNDPSVMATFAARVVMSNSWPLSALARRSGSYRTPISRSTPDKFRDIDLMSIARICHSNKSLSVTLGQEPSCILSDTTSTLCCRVTKASALGFTHMCSTSARARAVYCSCFAPSVSAIRLQQTIYRTGTDSKAQRAAT